MADRTPKSTANWPAHDLPLMPLDTSDHSNYGHFICIIIKFYLNNYKCGVCIYFSWRSCDSAGFCIPCKQKGEFQQRSNAGNNKLVAWLCVCVLYCTNTQLLMLQLFSNFCDTTNKGISKWQSKQLFNRKK